MAEIRVDHGGGRQVPEASVTEAEYAVPTGREALILESSFFVLY